MPEPLWTSPDGEWVVASCADIPKGCRVGHYFDVSERGISEAATSDLAIGNRSRVGGFAHQYFWPSQCCKVRARDLPWLAKEEKTWWEDQVLPEDGAALLSHPPLPADRITDEAMMYDGSHLAALQRAIVECSDTAAVPRVMVAPTAGWSQLREARQAERRSPLVYMSWEEPDWHYRRTVDEDDDYEVPF